MFENHNGEARYVADYYITIGKNGIDKTKEGDKKTPLGVYHVTGNIPREKLTPPTARRATSTAPARFPISYPNEWDRRQGRNGYGIWLHGTPSDTYSRPPRASDGCVVLTNEDFEVIAKYAQVGVTPVIIANGIEWVSRGRGQGAARGPRAERRELAPRLGKPRHRQVPHALRARASPPASMDLAQWSEQKRKVNAGKTWIKVKLDKVSIFLYPGRDDLAVVTFDQDYASSNLSNQMRKRQYWIREGGAWRILHEGAA